ncbi:MAG: efflux transporter outer membrane subunit [Tepidisphaeraceae bacterium]
MSERNAIPAVAAIAVCSMSLSGCMVGPDFHPPQTDAPSGWHAPATVPSTQNSIPTTQPSDLALWWTNFDDPVLDSLVQRAIDENLDLKLAESRIRQARAQRRFTSGALWPQVDADAAYTRARGPGGSSSNSGLLDDSGDLFQVGFDAAWEIDVFGGLRRNVESAQANVVFTIEDRRDVLVTLVSEVAVNYIDLRGFQQQAAIARQNLETQEKTLDLTRRRFRAGFVSGLDVANAEAQVATTKSTIPLFESAARQLIYALGVLLAEQPGALIDELDPRGPIPHAPSQVPVGLPSELLRRRPDIRRAEAQLHSATAQVGVATADWFPKFALTGSLGTQATEFPGLFDWSNRFWSVGAPVTWRIFDGGRIAANVDVQNELQAQALLSYRQTVLQALSDVESALVSFVKEQEHREALSEAVVANRRAVDLSTRLYNQGQTDFLNVLNSQRALFATEDALAASERTVATNLVAIYKALGGGWESEPTKQPSK